MSQLDRIEGKLDDIRELVLKHETQISDPNIGIMHIAQNNSSRIKSLETSRTRFIALVSGLSMSGGTVGAWLAKMFNLGGSHQ